MGQTKRQGESSDRSSNLQAVQRQDAGGPGKRSLVEQVYGHPVAAAPAGRSAAVQLQPAPTQAPAAHPFQAKLDEFRARRDAVRKQLDAKQTDPLVFTTTMVGMYSNAVFQNWEPWRKDAQAIADTALALKTEIMNTLVDTRLDLDKPDDKRMEDEALAIAEKAGFMFIDASNTLLPRTTTVTVIERVDDVVFTTASKYTMDLQTWLDRVKADYEAASKAKSGGTGTAKPA
jgi:hypothetical protein